jgi:predicted amidohydrolase YtcJ
MAARAAAAQEIETILVNGKILTVDPQSSTRSALAIREGRIAALGTDADIRRLAGPRTRTIDLQGRPSFPA